MTKVAWDDSLSVGVEEIDEQHKTFLKLVNRLQAMYERDAARDLTFRLLLELVKYWEYHFISEENLMLFTKCPLLERHQHQHQKLLQTLGERTTACEAGHERIDSIVDFLTKWFIVHTKEEDKLVGQYINKLARDRGAQDKIQR
jgi:hemerythrin